MRPLADEHFASLEQQHEALRLGAWAFLASEVLVFSGLFTLYTVYRIAHAEGFAEASTELYQSIGTVNTAVLLASSYTMARAVRAAHAGRASTGARLLIVTAVIGLIFLAIKGVEYWLDGRESILPGIRFDPSKFTHPEQAEQFLTLYLVMTGIHAAHLLAGVLVVLGAAWLLRRGRVRVGPGTPIETIGLYWHFVDIVWVFLLPLLYLIQ